MASQLEALIGEIEAVATMLAAESGAAALAPLAVRFALWRRSLATLDGVPDRERAILALLGAERSLLDGGRLGLGAGLAVRLRLDALVRALRPPPLPLPPLP